MSEQNQKSLSISFRVDDGVLGHNNREFIADNVDCERVNDNITYVSCDIREVYDDLFGQALAEYNAKQRRSDRRIEDYYEHITKSDRVKPFYEVVVQFGDVDTCGVKSDKWEQAKLMLDDYMRDFKRRNPNLKVFNAVMHLDETTPHLHIDFIPVCRNVQKGLSVKVSMKGALREQGFYSSNKLQNEWSAWEESERKAMTEILHNHNLSRDIKDVHREHLTLDDYKQYAIQKAEIHKTNEQINLLKKKNPVELTPDEIELIKNQNDIMRSEIQKRDEKISSLSRKLGAKFVPFEIFDSDKLQYVAAELEKANVPFVEESNAVYIPDYALNTTMMITKAYKPQKCDNIRERIKLDIDRLVLCSADLEDLFGKLKERGYQVKDGKYIAVKPPFGERFVRLKSLDAAYLTKNLEQRISERDKFPTAVREQFATANALEKPFHVTIIEMMTAVKEFRITPRKTNPKLIYAFKNDANINYLSEQLCTIGEFNLSSSEQMYAKTEELKAANDTAGLKRVTELIKAYESIVEGNYIDSLIKAQQEKNRAHKTII